MTKRNTETARDHWIRLGRKKRGLSQANLSRVTDIVQAKISQWELGKCKPTPEQGERIRQVFRELDEGRIPDGLLLRNHRRASSSAPLSRSKEDSHPENESPKGWFKPLMLDRQLHKTSRPKGPTVLACFAGCGGMSLGFRQAGYAIKGFIEINEAARTTYQQNFQEAVSLAADIRDVNPKHADNWREVLGPIDVLCGGPPCQGFSLAGKRDKHDNRNTLFRDYIGIAEHLKPQVIVMENVRLFTSMKGPDGRLMPDYVREEFEKIGYGVEYQVINAQDFGVPQFRERVIFIAAKHSAHVGTDYFPLPTHGPTSSADLFGCHIEAYRTFRDATGDLEPLESGEASKKDALHWAVNHPDRVIQWLQGVPEGCSAHENENPELRPPSGYNTTYKRLRWNEPSSTIGTTFGMISACRTVHPTCTRSLTIREAMRCQTFPDDFSLHGNAGQMRTQIGNAVPPRLAFVLAEHIRQNLLQDISSHRKVAL